MGTVPAMSTFMYICRLILCTVMTIREEKDYPICPHCHKRMAQIIEEGKIVYYECLQRITRICGHKEFSA